MPESNTSIVPSERIFRSIIFIRGHKVILDKDLAVLYGTETKQLLRAVKRNIARFPIDFMFQLNNSEFNNRKSDIYPKPRKIMKRQQNLET